MTTFDVISNPFRLLRNHALCPLSPYIGAEVEQSVLPAIFLALAGGSSQWCEESLNMLHLLV